MFTRYTGTEIEDGYLRTTRRFRPWKRRKTVTWRRSCSTTRGWDYELTSHLEEGSCDEEEEYQLISEGEEESKESTESLRIEHEYCIPTMLHKSPEVRYKNSSLSGFVNINSNNALNNRQGSMTT